MTTNDLVTKGFFPEELPAPFGTMDLSKVINEIINHPDSYPIQAGANNNGRPITCKTLPFSIPKIRAYRRNLGIPHPLLYIKFSEYISLNWNEILTHSESPLSLSPLLIEDGTSRSLVQPSFDSITKERILRSTGYRFVLKVDIQNFYGSIYTHSIPWVIHTKPVAKEHRLDRNLLGNRIDWFIRNMQDSQTIGIPIGPDASRIVSEIIAAHIDRRLASELGDGILKGIRVVDDYNLYFKDMANLERSRAIILKLLREMELDLNQAKEKVQVLPEIIESDWYHNLRQFKFTNKKGKQTKEIIAYFDMSFKYSEQFPSEAILPYSISKIAATIFLDESWPVLEALLLKSLQIEPKILPYIVKLFITHKDEGYQLSADTISTTLNGFLEEHLGLGNHFEIVWTLWLMKLLKLKVSKKAAEELSKSNNSIVILITLDLNESNLIGEGLDTTDWEQYMTAENLYTEHWLLAYEASVKNWLPVEDDYIETNSFFKLLRDNDVSFYTLDDDWDLSGMKLVRDSEYLPKHKQDDDNDGDGDAEHDFRRRIGPLNNLTKEQVEEFKNNLFNNTGPFKGPDNIMDIPF